MLGESRGLVVKPEDSQLSGCGLEPLHRILDGVAKLTITTEKRKVVKWGTPKKVFKKQNIKYLITLSQNESIFPRSTITSCLFTVSQPKSLASLCYHKLFGYCYHSVNVISFSLCPKVITLRYVGCPTKGNLFSPGVLKLFCIATFQTFTKFLRP